MALSAEEREKFLAEPHIGALSVSNRTWSAITGTIASTHRKAANGTVER